MRSFNWASTAVVAVFAAVLSAGPVAAADVAQPAAAAVGTSSAVAAIVEPAIAWHVPPTFCSGGWTFRDRWGHTGTFKCGSYVMEVNWDNRNRIEYFGIAPNRTIWHSWATSGWAVMPHNGLADDTNGAWNTYGGARTVRVYVNNSGYWCAEDRGTGWGGWWRC
ncbi:hypothetical protein [Micromonospora sp. CB01531]|uniref:hypothetical protein n=1 Tax=Micromonospora sp. CB01531 TaxID=1718947 RepID=UPI00093DE17D|nr:hypothetical protein [Micromonospora sp. CB01531]OKI60833.1 hypothetical protein A6A27_28945 [Micromonospora sp. CB01531]